MSRTIALILFTVALPARGNVSSTGNVEVTKWTDELPPVTVFVQPRRKL